MVGDGVYTFREEKDLLIENMRAELYDKRNLRIEHGEVSILQEKLGII